MAQPHRIGALPNGYPRMLPPTATVLHTDADGLEAGEVWIPVGDGELPAYRAAVESGASSDPAGDYRASYQPGPARDGWKRMLDWLRANGAG